MSLTLLVENNPRLESYYSLNLSTWLGLETVIRNNSEGALALLEKNSGLKLIIVRAKIGKEPTAQIIQEYLARKSLKIALVVLGGGQEFAGPNQITNSLDLRPLIKFAASALGITAKDMSSKVVPDFYPIPLSVFSNIKKTVTDVFQKMGDSHQTIFNRSEIIDQKVVSTLIASGTEFLYVNKLERLEFVNNAGLELIAQLEREKLNDDEQLTAIDKSVELLSKKLITIGVTEETIHLANKNMAHIKEQTKKNPNLGILAARLFNNKNSYIFLHTQILTFIALHIIKHIDWGTPEQEDKISFIAFFHDIVLENDEQARIKSMTELKLSQLPPEKKQLVERHAQIAGELVSKFPHAPMSADQIIKQHHGNLNGLGFSEHFGANISPIATVFIVAEEFTRIVLKRETGPFDRNEMIRELKAEFPSARLAKIVDLLKTITF